MKTLKQLLDGKNGKLASITPDQPVLRALEIMAEYDVGALLVLDGPRLAGIFSERDYARKVILHGKASRNTPVRDVMTSRVICVTPERTIEDCMAIMTEKHIRHLPVLDAQQHVIGVISIGDVVKELLSQQQYIIGQLESYITR
jgi:CBS domain-containing protein